jgi:serine/threonine-protein kinase
MSPEQSRMAPLDARSDVFSLGSVLFEFAVGTPPFGDDHTPGTLDKLRKCDPDRLARLLVEADVPSWLTQVVLGCLRREPDDRYPTAAAVADALEEGMRRAGVVQSEARASLARRATSVRDQIGPVYPVEPLPPLIAADPTGAHRAIPVGRRLPAWVGGLAMAAAGALVVLVGLFVYEAVAQRRAAQANDPGAPSDMQNPDPLPSPPPDRAVVPIAEQPGPRPDGRTTAEDDDVVLEPARRRKRSTTPTDDPVAEFKPNPYD